MSRPVEFEIQQVFDSRDFAKDFAIRRSNATEETTCRLGLSAPPETLRLGYGDGASGYLRQGEDDTKSVRDILSRHGWELPHGGRVLDFGCAAGRLTRWVTSVWPKSEAWGVDIDAERITWARLYLGSVARFSMTTKIPHLPFPDQHFDLAFAFSVFTHIDDLAHAWLLELARVLKPGGAAVVTIMDEHTTKVMTTRYAAHGLPQRLLGYRHYYEAPHEMFVITRDSVPDVWYRGEYFASLAGDAFDVLEMRPEFHGWQTGVAMRKR
ncbi:MAG TPA: methyltransferase domain-containing protein [Dongiaceae bacterium]